MKMKQKNQVLISSVYALLISVVLLLAPSAMKAQTGPYLDAEGKVIATDDSRMVITIAETDNNVELQVAMLGVIRASSIQLTFLYQQSTLTLTDKTFGATFNPGGPLTRDAVTLAPVFENYRAFDWTADFYPPEIGTTGKIPFIVEIATMSPLDTLKVPATEVTQIFKIYFNKTSPGTDLTESDLGFYCQETFPWISSFWGSRGQSVSYGRLGPSEGHTIVRELFTYRSASFSEADSVATEKTATSVDLWGTFNRNSSNLPAGNSLLVSNSNGSDAPNNGSLKNDLIQVHGFIYSDESADIITGDFADSLSINGVKYLPSAAEMAAGKFVVNGKTFFIVWETTTSTAESFADKMTLDGLFANTNYYAWSFIQYTFESSNTFISVSPPLGPFQTGTCDPVNEPVAIDQSFCTGAGATFVSDLYAEIDEPLNTLKWYASATATTALADNYALVNGDTYYARSVTPSNCASDPVAVTVTLGVTLAAPIAVTPQEFCEAATVADLRATGVGIKWYDAENGTSELVSTTGLDDGATYWAESSTAAGCVSATRTPVRVSIGNFIPNRPVIPSPQDLCGTPTVQDIITNDAVSVVWYDDADNVLQLTDLLEDGKTYYYAVSGAGIQCPGSDKVGVVINIVQDNPAAPQLEDEYTFCPGATLASIPVPNNKIVWYISDTGGTALDPATILTDGVTYYAAQQAGSCESDNRTAVLILVGDAGAGAPEVPAIQPPLCVGSTLADLTITGSAIVWYATENAITQLGPNDPEWILKDGVTYWAAQSSGSCVTERVAVVANLDIPVLPGSIAASQSFCSSAVVGDLMPKGLRWYVGTSAADADSIPSSTALVNGSTYYAKAPLGKCLSGFSTGVTVRLIDGDLNAPIAVNPQYFCDGATVANLQARGVGIQWYKENEIVPLPADTELEDGVIYSASQSAGSCESADRTDVKVIINNERQVPSPNVKTPQTLCAPATLQYVALPADSARNIVWYADATSTAQLPLTTDITVDGIYYAAFVAGDCESAVRTPVSITIDRGTQRPSAPDPEVRTPQNFCEGTTLASVELPNSQIVWYAAWDSPIEEALDPAMLLSSTTYYAAQRAGTGSCQTGFDKRQAVVINIGATDPPQASSSQSFMCRSTVADLQVIGSNVTWYADPIGGTALSLEDELVSRIYYASQGTGNCQSITRTVVTVTVGDGLPAPVAQRRQSFCDVTDATIASLQPSGKNILWYDSEEGGQLLPPDELLIVGHTYYAVQMEGNCKSETRSPVTVVGGIEIIQKDNHILVINNNFDTNGNFDFTRYVWYKDGHIVKEGDHGAGKGGYYVEGDLNGLTLSETAEYKVRLTDIDGGIYWTCPADIHIDQAKGSISVYPNPLVSSQMVYVNADIDESVLETAHIEIYSPLGSYIGRVKAQRITPVRLPEEKGVYVLKFKSSETEEIFKVIVK